jgi:hypothetical protein
MLGIFCKQTWILQIIFLLMWFFHPFVQINTIVEHTMYMDSVQMNLGCVLLHTVIKDEMMEKMNWFCELQVPFKWSIECHYIQFEFNYMQIQI